jgi:hypothetical protein
MECEKVNKVEGGFKVVGRCKGLGGKGMATGVADKTLDCAESCGVVKAEAGKPG